MTPVTTFDSIVKRTVRPMTGACVAVCTNAASGAFAPWAPAVAPSFVTSGGLAIPPTVIAIVAVHEPSAIVAVYGPVSGYASFVVAPSRIGCGGRPSPGANVAGALERFVTVNAAPASGLVVDTVNAVTGMLGLDGGVTAFVHASTSTGGLGGDTGVGAGTLLPGLRSGGMVGQSSTSPNMTSHNQPCVVFTRATPTAFHCAFNWFASCAAESLNAMSASTALVVPRTRFSPTSVPG